MINNKAVTRVGSFLGIISPLMGGNGGVTKA